MHIWITNRNDAFSGSKPVKGGKVREPLVRVCDHSRRQFLSIAYCVLQTFEISARRVINERNNQSNLISVLNNI